MKYNFKYLAICTLALSMAAGCKRSFLELSNPNTTSSGNYINDATSLKGALTSSYNTLLPIYNGYIPLFGDIVSDNSTAQIGGPAWNNLDAFSFNVQDGNFSGFWSASFKSIAQCNLVIGKGAAVSMDANLQARYLAEGKFIRALNYFNLVRVFGDVPLVTIPLDNFQDSYNYGRQQAADVYAQIVKDLSEAATVLPATYTGADVGRATKGAAYALLGKVYLTQKKYTEALTALDNVTGYSLISDYNSLFSITNEMNSEVIFAVRYAKGSQKGLGSSLGYNMIPISPANNGAGYNTEMPEIGSLYSAGDNRAAISVAYIAGTGVRPTPYYCKKFTTDAAGLASTPGDLENDFMVIRYADVLLMKAEALNELNRTLEAFLPINDVRQRAGLTPLVGLNQANFRLAVENERRLELCMEGHRWFDLVRTGRALAVMNAHFAANTAYYGSTPPVLAADGHQLLFPIPDNERKINPKLAQNPGY